MGKRVSKKQLMELVSKVNVKGERLQMFEQAYNNIAENLKLVDVSPLRFTSSDLQLDVANTISAYKSNKIGAYDAYDRLNQVVKVADKYASFRDMSLDDARTTLTADILASLRTSKRYQGMIDSAFSKSNTSAADEEDFFYRVIGEAMQLRGVDKQKLLVKLNYRLKRDGFNRVNKTLLNSYINK